MCSLTPGLVLETTCSLARPQDDLHVTSVTRKKETFVTGARNGLGVGKRFSTPLQISRCSTGFSQKPEGTHFTDEVSGDGSHGQPCQFTELPFSQP